MREWLKRPVSKTGVPLWYRGFEPHSLRQCIIGADFLSSENGKEQENCPPAEL